MKKMLFSVLLMSIMFFVSNLSLAADTWNVNANFVVGAKALDEDDWEPLESQPELGVNFDFAPKSWPFSIAIGLLSSSKEDTETVIDGFDQYDVDIEGSTVELRAGLKKIWEATPTMRPFISGGLVLINAEVKGTLDIEGYDFSISADDNSVGGYISGGIYWTLAKHLNLGFEVGYSKATVSKYDIDIEAGGGHALFLVGYHW